MDKCAGKDCQNEGTEYRDYTVTGVGDFRYFCKGCVVEADRKRKIKFAESKVVYAESVLRNATAEVDRAKAELEQEKARLESLIAKHKGE